MTSYETYKWISDDDLAKNIKHHSDGELVDGPCKECNLSLLLHPFPKKHYCDFIKKKKDIDEEEWVKVQLSLMNRMNTMVLIDRVEVKDSKSLNVLKKSYKI